MTVQESLVAYIAGLPALSSLVGGRVHFGILPQSVLLALSAGQGAISLYTVADSDQVSHSGRSGRSRTRFQATCWGKSYTDAHAIASALKPALSGVVIDGGFGPLFYVSRRDMRDTGENVFQVMLDFAVWNGD